MKPQMQLIISDKPVHEARMTNARKQHDRRLAIDALVAQGHVEIMNDMNPKEIRVRVADEYFIDPRRLFPTEKLLARVQLAVNAGNSCQNFDKQSELRRHALDMMAYGFKAKKFDTLGLFGDTHIGQFTNAVTATVKPRRPRP